MLFKYISNILWDHSDVQASLVLGFCTIIGACFVIIAALISFAATKIQIATSAKDTKVILHRRYVSWLNVMINTHHSLAAENAARAFEIKNWNELDPCLNSLKSDQIGNWAKENYPVRPQAMPEFMDLLPLTPKILRDQITAGNEAVQIIVQSLTLARAFFRRRLFTPVFDRHIHDFQIIIAVGNLTSAYQKLIGAYDAGLKYGAQHLINQTRKISPDVMEF